MIGLNIVTAALPYANNHLHLGHMLSTMLPADIYVRYLRAKGEKVLFISGTDAHGTPIVLEAIKTKKRVEDVLKRWHSKHLQICKAFHISYDSYGTTHSKQHQNITHKIVEKFFQSGDIKVKANTLDFCNTHGFIPDRMKRIGCSLCRYNFANNVSNDCECAENTEEICSICGLPATLKESDVLVMKLTKTLSQNYLNKMHIDDERKSIMQASINEVEDEKEISRNMSWGINVPKNIQKHMRDKAVVYVWYEALLSYISIIGETEWNNSKTITQFMGKDNLYFHLHLLPNIYSDFKLPTRVIAGNFMLMDNKKFSKSLGIGVQCKEVIENNINTDYMRFYLAYISNITSDSSFSWEHFKNIINNILVKKIGNAFQRVFKMFKNKKTVLLSTINKNNILELEELNSLLSQFHVQMTNCRISNSINICMRMADSVNTLIDSEKLWINMNNQALVNKVLFHLATISWCLSFFIPESIKIIEKTIFKKFPKGKDVSEIYFCVNRIILPNKMPKRVFKPID